ncbi:endo-1,4-beta-xylanase [Streptomyces sp. NPDC051976]|uniref:endo-1,4-beta-xylanase n=1 Tax=Streptomyces sp. NPDC051976 TaxID=3154947 RepID=UPI003421D717
MTPKFRLPFSGKPRLRAVGAGLAVAVAGVPFLAMSAAGPAAAATSLRTLAEAQGRYFGTALTDSDLSNSNEISISNAQFDAVTPGNEMKWDAVEPGNGQYNFGPGDQIASYARSHGMRLRGHNLVWQNQLPSWVNNLPLSQVQGAMDAHITTEVNHYKGQIYAWDVVNEPFNGDGSFVNDVFSRAMGSTYFAEALRTAHAADPNAKLYINDYNIEGQNAKSNALYNLAKTLLAQGVPLGGIGFESHFIVGQVPSDFQANMQRFAALGLDVAVTELDDRIQLPASNAALQQQATDYGNVVKDCLAVSRCVGISQWGVDDGNSWIPGTFPGWGAATMYDSTFQPKPAYAATATALGSGATPPPSSTPPSSTPPSSPPPTGSAPCKVSTTVDAWNTGLTEQVTLTNTGSSTINGWKLGFTLPGGQTVVSAWNAAVSPSSGAVTATNLSYNASLAPGASTSFGLQADHTGNTSAPAAFALNGTPCTSG